VAKKPVFDEGVRWVVTPEGREAAEQLELCMCEVKLVGVYAHCPQCKTVYGYIKDMFRPTSTRYMKDHR
jgi:hypothetical protein